MGGQNARNSKEKQAFWVRRGGRYNLTSDFWSLRMRSLWVARLQGILRKSEHSRSEEEAGTNGGETSEALG